MNSALSLKTFSRYNTYNVLCPSSLAGLTPLPLPRRLLGPIHTVATESMAPFPTPSQGKGRPLPSPPNTPPSERQQLSTPDRILSHDDIPYPDFQARLNALQWGESTSADRRPSPPSISSLLKASGGSLNEQAGPISSETFHPTEPPARSQISPSASANIPNLAKKFESLLNKKSVTTESGTFIVEPNLLGGKLTSQETVENILNGAQIQIDRTGHIVSRTDWGIRLNMIYTLPSGRTFVRVDKGKTRIAWPTFGTDANNTGRNPSSGGNGSYGDSNNAGSASGSSKVVIGDGATGRAIRDGLIDCIHSALNLDTTPRTTQLLRNGLTLGEAFVAKKKVSPETITVTIIIAASPGFVLALHHLVPRSFFTSDRLTTLVGGVSGVVAIVITLALLTYVEDPEVISLRLRYRFLLVRRRRKCGWPMMELWESAVSEFCNTIKNGISLRNLQPYL
ncbi:hypothetical protein M427DRAFT_147541 [Gonapodya prolifera JEL478]|uniref:Uncharacterized protein n=1 Tax=Gonapodya prolifera (strain JEL478) TaxID=1344416 RepID=A0A139A5A1_GONPJ|nr:hypothetical protein M427DRAFT_147541 [Gonapodya prolifera JEL478]|eukprot:KXS11818.1 hypothetical protein M427DRAFT_147541 [Gonapodya prolifera JEL478]